MRIGPSQRDRKRLQEFAVILIRPAHQFESALPVACLDEDRQGQN